MKKRLACEQYTFEEAVEALPRKRAWARVVFERLEGAGLLRPKPAVLDIGASSGGFLVACQELGVDAVGVEPWEPSRLRAARVAERLGVTMEIRAGRAEDIPWEDESFDVVHAASVIEHVEDVQAAFREIYRVLRPGGVFWFYTASSVCPKQHEISWFPLFGWYPNALKLRIMDWAKRSRPEWVGHTETPAINWFTPWKAERLLREAGFSKVWDRWDLKTSAEIEGIRRWILKVVRLNRLTKLAADVVVPECSYAAVKT